MKNKIYLEQMELGGMANFSYLIGDLSCGQAAVVDPNDDTAQIEQAAAKAGLKVTSVLLTHGHYDHTGGLKYYSDKMHLPVFLSKDEFLLYIPACKTLQRISDQAQLTTGTIPITSLSTPGHTPGCMCFYVEGNLFTGDTLFVEAIGRTDLPGGSARALYKSLQKIKQLPDETIIWPGHNYGDSTRERLGNLKRTNPFLACQTEAEFLDLTG
ncbi:MAG: MBL fold metallo-hydrolase [Candidatus Omnitrophica bacterium]|nr:MBL fold metallo-hydrolase [Candidatus Omnitrophota bacterium]